MVQREQVVDQVGVAVGQLVPLMGCPHRRVELFDPLAGASEPRRPHQHGRPLAGDPRREERAHEDDHVVQVVAGGHSRRDGAELVGDDPLQRVQAGNGLGEGPGGDLAPRDGDNVVQVLVDEGARVARPLGLAHTGVLGPVHAQHRARRSQFAVELHPELARAQVRLPVAHDEQVGLRPRKNREPAVKRVHAEDRTELQVLPGEERPDVAGHGEGVPDQGQARRGGRRRRGRYLSHYQLRLYHDADPHPTRSPTPTPIPARALRCPVGRTPRPPPRGDDSHPRIAISSRAILKRPDVESCDFQDTE